MLLVHLLQVVCLALLVFEEILGVFFPDDGLFFVDFLLFCLFCSFFFDLSGKVLSHLLFLLLLLSGSSFFFLLFFFKLIFNVSEHFLILKSDLFLLILNDWVCKWSHDLLDFFLSFSLFLLSLSLKLILESGIFLLHFDILKLVKKVLKVVISQPIL